MALCRAGAEREAAVALGRDVAEQRAGEHQPAIRDDRAAGVGDSVGVNGERSEEHTSELQSLMRISYAVFCLKKKTKIKQTKSKAIKNKKHRDKEKRTTKT